MSCYDCFLFLIAVIFCVVIQEGTSLQCYVCKSSKDEACGYFTTTTGVAIQECSNSDDICFHIDYNVNATEGYPQYVERRCVSPNSIVCPSPPHRDDVFCTVCDTNLCNNEPTTLRFANGTNDENLIGNNDHSHSATFRFAPVITIILGLLLLLHNL